MLLAELVSGKKIKQQDAPLRRLSVQPKEDSHELPRYMLQTEGMQWFGYYEFGLKSANSSIQITNREKYGTASGESGKYGTVSGESGCLLLWNLRTISRELIALY